MTILSKVEEFTDRLRPSEELLQELSGDGALTAGLSLKSAWRAAKRGDWCKCLRQSLDSKERSWEALHCGVWCEVLSCHREAYGLAGCLHVIAKAEVETEAQQRVHVDRQQCNESIVRDLDLVIMMGNPKVHGIAHDMIALLNQSKNSAATTTATLVTGKKRSTPLQLEAFEALSCKPSPIASSSRKHTNNRGIDFKRRRQYDPSVTVPDGVPRISNIGLSTFLETYLIPGRPVIITNYIDDWPAMESWPNMEYWRRLAALRTVPVEVGGKYTSDGWGQQLMTMNEFITDHIEGGGGGYLAQHELLEQIPALKKDLLTPEYTSMLREDEEVDAYTYGGVTTHIWFGPAGTISPCHTDPYHNLLAQAGPTNTTTTTLNVIIIASSLLNRHPFINF